MKNSIKLLKRKKIIGRIRSYYFKGMYSETRLKISALGRKERYFFINFLCLKMDRRYMLICFQPSFYLSPYFISESNQIFSLFMCVQLHHLFFTVFENDGIFSRILVILRVYPIKCLWHIVHEESHRNSSHPYMDIILCNVTLQLLSSRGRKYFATP